MVVLDPNKLFPILLFFNDDLTFYLLQSRLERPFPLICIRLLFKRLPRFILLEGFQ